MAIYQCAECEREEYMPRPYRYHFGTECRCPKCGTYRLAKLEKPDKIDKMHHGLLNFVERVTGGGKLYSCCFCRLQFYDRRHLAPRNVTVRPVERQPVTNQPGTAS